MHSPSLASALAVFGWLTLLTNASPVPGTSTAAPPLATNFPVPYDDPFYSIPGNIASYSPGDVIRSRSIESTEFGNNVKARQLFYRTNDCTGNATGTVTTIFLPAIAASPPQILSYQAAEDALGLQCAPSWASDNSTSTQESYLNGALDPIATWALLQGYYVVNSDDEGYTSAWLCGLQEGRATLDGIRATINDLDLSSLKPKTALLGYSGGAHESVWAASVAASYAPELDIVGAAYGGTPVDLKSAYDLLNGQTDAALAGGALVGLANGYPQLNATLNGLLTAKGRQVFEDFRTVDACLVETGSAFANFNFSSPEFFTGGDILKNPEVMHILSIESLLGNVSSIPVPVPLFPRYEWHGTNDSTVPYLPEVEYVEQQCAKGANIVFVPYPGLNHGEAAIIGLPGALLFISQAFSNTLIKTPCGNNISTPALGSAAAIKLLGQKVDSLLEAELANS